MAFVNQITAAIKKNSAMQWVVSLGIPLGLYIFILLNRYPYPLRSISMNIRYGISFVLPGLFLFFLLIFLPDGWIGRLAQLAGTLSIFALALAGLWAKGETEYYIISGLIPFVDASSYLNEAVRLLQGFQFSDFASWRPLFPAFLAPLLALTQQNLQLTLSVLVLLAGLSCLFLCLEIRRTHGAVTAAFVMTILFLYYRRFSGAIVPENLGLSLGCLGFALLWRGAYDKKLIDILWGTFFTSLALFFRLGAFLILPAIMVWSGRLFRKGKFISWKILVFTGIAALTAFFLYSGASALFSEKASLPLPYYSTVFYDLSAGYPTKFGLVKEEHPEINEIADENERSSEIYRLAFENFKNRPTATLQGAFSQWKLFFSYTWYGVYGFLIAGSQTITKILYIGMYALCVIGILSWGFDRKQAHLQLTLITVLAILLSVPFVPPQLFNRIRLFASSIPALVILPAMGFYQLLLWTNRKIHLKPLLSPRELAFPPGISIKYGASMIAFMLLGSLSVLLFRQPVQYQEITCPPEQEVVYLQYSTGSQINVIPENVFMIDWLPNFHNGKFRWYLHSTVHYDAITELENIVHPPATIINGLDLKSGREVVLIADSNIYPQPPSILGVCGNWHTSGSLSAYHLFYGETIQEVIP